jgi:hypothetical protein
VADVAHRALERVDAWWWDDLDDAVLGQSG